MPERYVDVVERQAGDRLPEAVRRYVDQGAGDGRSTEEATRAWDSLRLLPRVLTDVTAVDTSTTLLGTRVRTPFAVAPTSLQRAAHPDGEVATARAVAASESLLVLSSNAGSTFADVEATGVAWWLQVYLTADRALCLPLLESAVAHGARAVVLTADTPVVAAKDVAPEATVRELAQPGWLRVNFPPGHDSGPGHEKATDLGPQDVAWLHRVTGLPVVVKGVLHPLDARRCVDAGAAAVWVSNHGGRQLDGAVATAHALRAVAEASSVEVYVDGGLRRGVHAVAAAALGARAVFLGRPPLHALAVDGEAGVVRLLEELGRELVEALRLSGHPRWAHVPPGLVVP